MIYQKCSNCQSEWNGIKMILRCPFCETEFQIQKGDFSTVEETIRYITLVHGSHIVKEHKTFLSLFTDYAPTLERERRVLRIVLEAGIYESLLSAHKGDSREREVVIAKAVSTLHDDFLIDKTWAEQGIKWFASFLGWIPLQQEKPVTIIPAENTFFAPPKPVPASQPQPTYYTSAAGYSVGDKISFGSYHYSKFGSRQPIIWTILERHGNKALLWSDCCIDARPFRGYREQCTWLGSYLEYWLNLSFKAEAFSKDELRAIIETDVRTSVNSQSGITTGHASRNRIFILSNEEMYRYGLTDLQIKGIATPYAIDRGIFVSQKGDAHYWVRTPGITSCTCMFVGADGKRDFNGNYTDQKGKGVRPAIWVDLDILCSLPRDNK